MAIKTAFTQRQKEKIIQGLPESFKKQFKESSPSNKAILAASLDEFLSYVSMQNDPIEYLKNNVPGFTYDDK